MAKVNSDVVGYGQEQITIENIVTLGQGVARAELSPHTEFVEKIQKSVDFLNDLLQEDGVIYGVTTGYGDSCTVDIPAELVPELPLSLARFHCCGLGDDFSRVQSRAIVATCLSFLSRGCSGIRPPILERLLALLNLDIVPRIPQERSVGASGDLTPLSYVAAACLLAAVQALELRWRNDSKVLADISGPLGAMCRICREDSSFLTEDRTLEWDLRHFITLIRNKQWEIYID